MAGPDSEDDEAEDQTIGVPATKVGVDVPEIGEEDGDDDGG